MTKKKWRARLKFTGIIPLYVGSLCWKLEDLGSPGTHQPRDVLIRSFLYNGIVKTDNVEVALKSLSKCLHAKLFYKESQIMDEYQCQGVRLIFFISRSCGGRPDLKGILTGKKVSIWVLETWDHHHWMPVKYGILIYVSHLGSSSLPCWATRWTRSGTSRGTSTGQETQPILAVSQTFLDNYLRLSWATIVYYLKELS